MSANRPRPSASPTPALPGLATPDRAALADLSDRRLRAAVKTTPPAELAEYIIRLRSEVRSLREAARRAAEAAVEPPDLDRHERAVLAALGRAGGGRLSVSRIAAGQRTAGERTARDWRTVKRCLTRLQKDALVEPPRRGRPGWRITRRGRTAVSRVSDV